MLWCTRSTCCARFVTRNGEETIWSVVLLLLQGTAVPIHRSLMWNLSMLSLILFERCQTWRFEHFEHSCERTSTYLACLKIASSCTLSLLSLSAWNWHAINFVAFIFFDRRFRRPRSSGVEMFASRHRSSCVIRLCFVVVAALTVRNLAGPGSHKNYSSCSWNYLWGLGSGSLSCSICQTVTSDE